MSVQVRLTVMNFMQFFVWGAWLISLGTYMIVTLGFSGGQVGSIYATMGVAALFMPGLMGIVADRWLNAERLYGILHLVGAGLLLWASTAKDFDTLYVIWSGGDDSYFRVAFCFATIASTSASNFFASYTIPSLTVYLIPPTRSGRPVSSFTLMAPVP